MKVLFITHCTAMAGANRSMLQLVIELRDVYSVEPFVILPPEHVEKVSLKSYLEKGNISFKEVEMPCFKQGSRLRKMRLQFYDAYRSIDREIPFLKAMNFDLVHSNSSIIDVGGYLSRKLGVKHVWHLRDFGELDYNLYSIWGKLYERLTYCNGDAFIAISYAIKQYFERQIPSSKLQVIYNGVKINDNVPKASHNNEIVKFICAGVICEAKNQLEILKAINIIVNERGIKCLHLYLVGIEESDYIKKVRTYIQQNGLEPYVSICGEVDGIETLASSMDVGIMASRCEAFGRVTVEYMLMNLAVIANESGANPEIIHDGKTGLIYKCSDEESLADKMLILIEDYDTLIKIAANGKKEAEERFLSKQNTLLIYKLYEQLLSSPNRLTQRINFSYWLLCLYHLKDLIAKLLK